ncbi:hypothetical protein [Bradyrhizobium elkanii]|uniref:hypothetical protein n=1 Tax=Bradyrhizobium elkanii TaxID=29448 RepID=UPI003512EB16
MARKKKEPETYTALQVEAALCVWECLNEWTLGSEAQVAKLEKAAKKDPHSMAAIRVEWIEMREQCGSAEMRSQSIVLGLWCLEIYDILTANDEEFFSYWSYDWEVIPAMLKHAVCKDGKASMYRGDYIYTGGGLIDAHSAAQLVAQEFAWLRYEDDCKSQARQQWAYEELVTDDRKSRDDPSDSRMLSAFEQGEAPPAFVKWLGEKYDLTPAGPGFR